MIMTFKMYFYITSIMFLFLFSSFVSKKKLTYLQYSAAIDKEHTDSNYRTTKQLPAAYKIMAYDNLFINVSSPDAR